MSIPRPERVCRCSAAVIKNAPCVIHRYAYRVLSSLIKAEKALSDYETSQGWKASELVKDIRMTIRLAGGR